MTHSQLRKLRRELARVQYQLIGVEQIKSGFTRVFPTSQVDDGHMTRIVRQIESATLAELASIADNNTFAHANET